MYVELELSDRVVDVEEITDRDLTPRERGRQLLRHRLLQGHARNGHPRLNGRSTLHAGTRAGRSARMSLVIAVDCRRVSPSLIGRAEVAATADQAVALDPEHFTRAEYE